jgi:spore coat polysaccharide biosynthesis protein SpsF (cytidylyltransferase family)
MKTAALLSMLHESPGVNSVTRQFRADSVIGWTVSRLRQSRKLSDVVIAAWDDQINLIEPLGLDARIVRVGTRRSIASLDAVTAAQKWSNGWRGGLLSTCAYDRGYLNPVALDVANASDAIVLVDPASALVDPTIIDRLIDAAAAGSRDYYFTQAPPGLAGVLLKRAMVQRLSDGAAHPGRIVHYLPDAPVLDPVTSDACVELPLSVSRSVERLTLDSSRQIERFVRATEPLNGTLISTAAEGIVQRLRGIEPCRSFPRDITLELTPRRSSKPVYGLATHHAVDRALITLHQIDKIAGELSRHDDVRLTLAGVGDPLLHPQFVQILQRLRGVHALSIETDLIDVSDAILHAIATTNVDAISVHLPAMSAAVYQRVMGVDRLMQAVENVKRLIALRQSSGGGTPIIVPTFTKLSTNFDEMEQWFDTWLRAVGSAVIVGPSDYCRQISDVSVADMTPPLRRPCARIESRLTILSDGSIVMCEQDGLGKFALGRIGSASIAEVWQDQMESIRDAHRGGMTLPVLCGNCREWHRP